MSIEMKNAQEINTHNNSQFTFTKSCLCCLFYIVEEEVSGCSETCSVNCEDFFVGQARCIK